MKITDVKTVLLTGPAGNDFGRLISHRSAAFIEIHTDTELIGIGETYTGYHAPEIVPAIVEFFRPILVGISEDQLDVRRLWARMYRCANFWCRVGAGANVLAGIEGALWDLKGKALGVPAWELLGGRCYDKLPCYATGGAALFPWEQVTRRIVAYREAGFRACKLGTGWYNPATKETYVTRNRDAWAALEREKLSVISKDIGPDFTVCLDGHMANPIREDDVEWDLGFARTIVQALEPFNLGFLEEPLSYQNRQGYAELTRSSRIPIAGGECLTTREEFMAFAETDAFALAQIDASFVGMAPFVDIAGLFASRHRSIATHAWSSGAGVMENIHAAFASPRVTWLEIPPLPGPLHTEIYADGFRFQDGYILPPQAPGLGVRLTTETKNRYPYVPGSGEWVNVPGKAVRI